MKELIYDYVNYIYIEKKLSDNTKEAYLTDLLSFNEFVNKNDNLEEIRYFIEQSLKK